MSSYRTGTITQIDTARALARVKFADIDALGSYWLPVLQGKTLKDKAYWLPDINEHVVCLLDENGEEGVILGAIYSEADAPPVNSQDKRHVTFEDGTSVEYDRATHKLTVDVKGDIIVNATGDCTVTVQGRTIIKSMGDVEIDGGSGDVTGVVTKACICAFTGKPHADYSADVTASKG